MSDRLGGGKVLQDQQGQIECAKCKKTFRGNQLAERIRCPLCNFVNLLNVKPLDPWVKPEVPKLTLQETRALVESIFNENVSGPGWEPVVTSYEYIASCNARQFCVGDNGNEVWVGIAESVVVPGKIEETFNVFWSLEEEMKWNTTSLKTNELVESNGTEQVVYQERKTHSSISMQGDILYRRTYEKWEDFIICWGKPEVHSKKPARGGWRRCEIVFLGFQVTKAGEDSCQIAMTSAFHELGNVPGLVIQDELKKISLRVSKVISRAADIKRLNSRNQPVVQKPVQQQQPVQQQKVDAPFQCTECGAASNGRFCGTCGGKCNSTVSSVASCPKCTALDNGGKFCAGCGTKLR